MRKRNIILNTVCSVSIILAFSCGLNISKVKKYRWKYQEGFHIGDILDFSLKEQYKVNNKGEIRKGNKYVAKVISVSEQNLMIESLDGEKGYYVYFDRITHD